MNERLGDPLLGSTLDDRYQIVRRIARGGMATVFEAVDLRLSRTVAVKVMHASLEADAAIAARFDTEARSAATLSHPNVVSVFDQGRDGSRPFIVMEYVRGITLRQLITLEAPFAAERALQLFEPVCSAVAAAHAAGIIHRDVKPENVLLSESGQVKVADFGLARNVTATTVAAEHGVVIGTVSYIAPELVSRGHASTRSDVYSLGILLYELLTGVKPHRGETPIEVAYAHVHRDVPAPSASGRVVGRLPGYLDDLVSTTTSRRLGGRQEDAGVLLRQVRGARDALVQGTDAPALRALMRATTPQAAEVSARELPELVGAAAPSSVAPAARIVARAVAPRAVVARSTNAVPSPAAGRGTTALRTAAPVRPAAERPVIPAARPARPDAAPTGRVPDRDLPPMRTGAGPLSPFSPPSRPASVRVTGPSGWNPSPVHRRRRMLAGTAAAAIIGLAGYGGWWGAVGRLPATPAVAGLAQTQAQDAVVQAGLGVNVVREFSETVPAGVAIRTEPEAGRRLEPGVTVNVYLSAGPQLFDVPALKGKTRDQAAAQLAALGLVVGTVSPTYSSAPADTVVEQSVDAGVGLRRGTAVDLVLSAGLEQVAVDDLTGRPGAEARAALAQAGFRVRTVTEHSATVPAGAVVRQSVAPGTAAKGSAITLTLSSGPGLVVVPDVRRLDAASAAAQLQAAGFTVTVQQGATAAAVPGTVVSTSPAVGRRAASGSVVTIVVG